MRTSALDKHVSVGTSSGGSCVSPALMPYCQALVNRLNLASGLIDAPQAIGFTSSASRAGVSTLAAGVAVLVAEGGRTALLVEANWKHASLAKRFGLLPEPGLSQLLVGEAGDDTAICATSAGGLSVLPCGQPLNSGMLMSARPALADCIQRWKARFDLIVFDFPPAMPEEVSMAWTGVLDGMLLVIQSEQTVAAEARRARQTLLDCQAHLLGAVLNQHRCHLPRWLS